MTTCRREITSLAQLVAERSEVPLETRLAALGVDSMPLGPISADIVEELRAPTAMWVSRAADIPGQEDGDSA